MRFMERVLFGDADVLSIDFHETNSDIVKDEIQSRFEKVHVEILLNQDRLKVLLETVRARSPGLLSELGKLSIPPTVWMARKMSGIVSQRKGRIGMPPITYHDDIDIHLGALQYGGTGCVELGCATDVGEKQNTHMNNSECSSLPHSLLPVKTQSSAEPRKLGAKYQAPSKYNINNTTSPTLTALKEQYQTAKLRVKAQQESVGKPIKNTIRVMENKEFSEGFGFYQDKDKSTQKKKKVVESVRASQEQLSQMFSQSPTAIRRALDTNHFRSGGFMQPDQLESFGWNF